MSYKIVIDSCGELPENRKTDLHYECVPLYMQVDEEIIVDDETFDQADFLKKLDKSSKCPKSSCPSPERYMQAFQGEADRVYVITLSGNLSGSYNSAVLGKCLYQEEYGEKQIHVFDSCSASVGEMLLALKIEECEQAGMDFEQVIRVVTEYRDQRKTYFVLESLEVLRKNGRLNNLKAFVANALNIKPIMGATEQGMIRQLSQTRGIDRAVVHMVEYLVKEIKEPEEKVIGISHCNCAERAQMAKEEILKRISVKEILILDTGGISSMYAGDGGIIIAG